MRRLHAAWHAWRAQHTWRFGLAAAVAWPLFAGPLPASAQSPAASTATPRTLCWLGATRRDETYSQAMVQRLAELGHVEGRNLTIEFRQGLGLEESFRAQARDLATRRCHVYFAPGNPISAKVLLETTKDTPIVTVANDYDPVARGFAASLSRPGGRITGVSQLVSELAAKRLQMARELMPGIRRVGLLMDDVTEPQAVAARAAAGRLGFELVEHRLGKPPFDLDAAFAHLVSGRAEILMPMSSGFIAARRQEIIAAARRHRLPTLFSNAVWVDLGGLASYGPNFSASYRRAAEQISRLFQGADAAQMPIEQPQVLELVLNLRTARELSLEVPGSIRLRADRLID